MHPLRRLLVALSILTLGAVAAVSAGAATRPPNPAKFKIKTRIAKLQIDVAGYVETRQLHDTTSDCYPGERWIQTNRFDFETGNFVNVSVKNISAQGIPSVTTSPFSRTVGRATITGAISDYKSTNHCAPTAPDKLSGPPACATNRGKISIALTPGDIPDENADLAPLKGRPLLLAVNRKGGGRDPLPCAGPGAGSLTGPDTNVAVVTTSLAPGVSLVLPADLDAIKVFAIRRTQRIRRAVVLHGPCSKVAVRPGPPPGATPNPGALNADSDCWLTGKVVLTIRSRR